MTVIVSPTMKVLIIVDADGCLTILIILMVDILVFAQHSEEILFYPYSDPSVFVISELYIL